MALVSKGFVVRVVLSDQGGKKATLTYPIDPAVLGVGTEYADAVALRAVILAELDPITDAAIFSHSLAEEFAEDTTFYGTGEVEERALVTAKLETAGKTVNFAIPAPADGIFVAASGPDFDIVDAADADLVAYLAMFEADIFTSDGEHIRDSATAGNIAGKRQHRASKHG